MYKKVFFTAIIFAAITSCKQTKSGFQYSEDIVDIERNLRQRVDSAELEVKRFVDAKQYDSIGVLANKMEGLIREKIGEINKKPLPNAKGVEVFRLAVIRYFNYMKSMYVAYQSWAYATTEEEREIKLETIQELADQSEEAVEEMQKAQQKYADANGFHLKK